MISTKIIRNTFWWVLCQVKGLLADPFVCRARRNHAPQENKLFCNIAVICEQGRGSTVSPTSLPYKDTGGSASTIISSRPGSELNHCETRSTDLDPMAFAYWIFLISQPWSGEPPPNQYHSMQSVLSGDITMIQYSKPSFPRTRLMATRTH
jgi:hypothetical protein